MKKKIEDIIWILLGNMIIALAVSTLILQNDIISGGVTGIGIVLNHYFGLSISQIVAVINMVLFLLGLFFIGKTFAMSTLISTFSFPLFLEIFSHQTWLQNYCEDPLLASILAGCMIGLGVGIMIRHHASSGGGDIIAIILNERLGIPVFIVLNAIDFIILLLQCQFSDTTKILYGLVTVFLTSFVLNKTLIQGTKAIQLLIMSEEYDAIRAMILDIGDAGVTLLDSEKGYSQEHTKVLLSIITPRKLPKIKEEIKRIDPKAFIVISSVDEVGGIGFTLDKNLQS